MIFLPKTLEKLKGSFSKLPGIGEKSAMRLALHLTSWKDAEIEEFIDSLRGIYDLKQCRECFVYTDDEICTICADQKRGEQKIICVVESINDFLAIERSEQYFGLYHITGGVLNPLMGIGPDQLNIESLVERVTCLGVGNVILAINPSVEGDATCSYIRGQLGENITVERIGFGLPMGGSLEYVDAMTVSKALENRTDF